MGEEGEGGGGKGKRGGGKKKKGGVRERSREMGGIRKRGQRESSQRGGEKKLLFKILRN